MIAACELHDVFVYVHMQVELVHGSGRDLGRTNLFIYVCWFCLHTLWLQVWWTTTSC